MPQMPQILMEGAPKREAFKQKHYGAKGRCSMNPKGHRRRGADTGKHALDNRSLWPVTPYENMKENDAK